MTWLAVVSTTLLLAQTPAAKLSVTGDVKTPISLTAAEIKTMPRTTVTIKDAGQDVAYEGVLVSEILKKADVTFGPGGNTLAAYVVATASDGYEVVFSIGELDPALTSNQIIVADTVDGRPLFGYQGPFRIMAPKDNRPARSIRMLETLKVVSLRK